MWPNRETERHAVIGVLPRDGVAWLSVSLHHFMHTHLQLVSKTISIVSSLNKTLSLQAASVVVEQFSQFV